MIKNAVGDAPVGDAPVGDAPVGDAPVVHVSRGIEFLEAGNSDDGQTEPAEEPGHEDEHGEVDPHTWFDPNNVIIWTDNIEQALSALDPANTVAYEANAQTYKRKLEELDAWIREQVAQIPAENRMLVTDHHVLSYFADEYGFEQVGAVIGAFSTIAEPSARELAALEDRIRQHGVPAVFVSSTVNPKVAARVAQDTGIELAPLYTGSLSKPSGDASTYLDFMRYNVRAIVSALR
ncbi:MAG: Manganese ABC transporter substrate-binding lipoprotein [Anaerolineales bacterium]|nr:Manganese ABC transporter substrate-binding lipoprotein [Anaerolineales bacterium]